MSGTLFALALTLVILLTSYIKKLQKAQLKTEYLFQYSDVATLFINTQDKIIDLNESALSLLGYSKKQIHGQKWYERLLPDEASLKIRHTLYKSLKEDARAAFDAKLIRADGEIIAVTYTLSHLPSPLHEYLLLTLIDKTQYRSDQQNHQYLSAQLQECKSALEQLEEQFKVTSDIAINGIVLLNREGDIRYLNRALTEMYEYNEDYIKHLGIRLLLDDDEAIHALLDTVRHGEKIEKMHIHSRTRSGKDLDIDLTLGYLPELQQYYMVIQDITKALAYTTALQQSKKHLEQRVIKDCLTTAYNRSYMEERLEQFMLKDKVSFGFIILDIDHFKQVNDTYGHLVGDDVLVNLVELLKEQLRRGDTLSRFGGEEFVIILPHATHEESLKIAHKLQKVIEETPFEGCPQITCSFGVEHFDGTQDKRTLLLSADKALYKAKEAGRNCVVDARTLAEPDYAI